MCKCTAEVHSWPWLGRAVRNEHHYAIEQASRTCRKILISTQATIVLGFLTVSGWGLGVLESILIVIVIGFSVDYTVHLADSYMQSRAIDREGKVTDALTHTGMSVLSGAISTILASIPMLFTQIIFFFKFGVFILLTIVLSLIFSLFFFASVLAEIGPSASAAR